jgi:hypothetical protein
LYNTWLIDVDVAHLLQSFGNQLHIQDFLDICNNISPSSHIVEIRESRDANKKLNIKSIGY